MRNRSVGSTRHSWAALPSLIIDESCRSVFLHRLDAILRVRFCRVALARISNYLTVLVPKSPAVFLCFIFVQLECCCHDAFLLPISQFLGSIVQLYASPAPCLRAFFDRSAYVAGFIERPKTDLLLSSLCLRSGSSVGTRPRTTLMKLAFYTTSVRKCQYRSGTLVPGLGGQVRQSVHLMPRVLSSQPPTTYVRA